MKNKLKAIFLLLIILIGLYYINRYLIENELKNYKFESAFFPNDATIQDYKSTTWHRSLLGSDCIDCYLYHEKLLFNSDSILTYSDIAIKLDNFFYLRKIFGVTKTYSKKYHYQSDSTKNNIILTPLDEVEAIDGIHHIYRIDIHADSLDFYFIGS